MSEPRDRPAASSLHRDRELEVSIRTVRLEELLAILRRHARLVVGVVAATVAAAGVVAYVTGPADPKSTRLNSSHGYISYAVFCLKKKKISIYWLYVTTLTTLSSAQ